MTKGTYYQPPVRKKGRRKSTTVRLRKITHDRLGHGRSQGQSYDGFMTQLLDLWEERKVYRTL
jgi:hypothetical protein